MLSESNAAKLVSGKIKNLENATRAGIRQGVFNLGKELKATATRDSQNKKIKKGRWYSYKGRKIRAGAAGQTAAKRSGTLLKSIDFKVVGSDGLEFGATAPYAKFLEKGTRRMAARPTLQNSMKDNYRTGRILIEEGIASKINI